MMISEVLMTDIQLLLIDFLGEPATVVQEDLLYFFEFFILIFVVDCIFDLIDNLTKF